MNMGDDVHSGLERAVADREEHARLGRRLHALGTELDELDRHVQQRRAALAEESREVHRLESFSPTKIWAALKGSHASDLERETAEREAARYALAEAEARRDALARDRDGLLAQRDALGDVSARYEEAVAAKESWLAQRGGPEAERLAQVAERRGVLRAVDTEAREAHGAGSEAARLLDQAVSLLDSAGSWATWDTFGGGGLVTDMIKHDKMDQANDLLRSADQALRTFSRELSDVRMPAVEELRVEGLSRTFDIWFDNMFSDMAVRMRIQDTRARAGDTRHQVGAALVALQAKGQALQAELAELDRERERLVRGASGPDLD